jgi:hypothetical protein
MAIFLTQNGEPSEFGLAYNDNAYVIKTTNYTPTVRFKISMLPETYPVEPAIGTVRVYPTRAEDGGTVYLDRGFFDPSRFLQSYVEGNARIEGANHNGFYTNNKTHKEYFLFIQEEDKNSQGVYVGGDSIFTKLKSVWNGVRNEIEWLDFDYTNYIINTTSTTKKFLTDSPRTIRIDSSQSYQLSFIVNEKYGAYQYVVKAYSGYNATGSLLANGLVANTTPSTDWSSKYFRIPVGTYDIGNIDPTLYTDSTLGTTPSTALTGAASYTIHLEDNTNAQTSERFTFNVNQTCSKYNEVRVHFLNRLGGYDAFNFYLKSIHQTDIKKDKYDQQNHDWNGFRYDYSKKSRGTTDYNVSLNKKLTVNTDYLSEEESVWMEDLITSPSAYIEENNELIAVNLDARRIQRKTSLNDKLMQYTFELSYSIKNRRQRG